MATTTQLVARWNEVSVAIQPASITMNASTSVKLLDEKQDRTWMRFHNNGNQDVFIKLQATSTDNLKQSPIILGAGESWEMTGTSIYNGEVCGIAAANGPGIFAGDM